MRFNCNGLTLAEAVLKVSKACAVRTTAPVMECIKITATGEGISLLATDGELSIEKKLNAEVMEEGAVCVPGKLFSDFVSKLSGEELDVSTGEKGVAIAYRDSKSYMQAISAEEFPAINLNAGENSFVMKQSAFKQIVAETVFCCAQDDSRPVLKGCLMELGETLKMTSLDGYRLAFSEASILSKSGEKNMICPARTLNEISKMLNGEEDEEVTLYEEGGQLLVKSEGTTIVSRLYRGDFIKRENVVPTRFSTYVTLDKAELMASAERAAIIIRGDKNNLVTLDISSERVKISSVSESGTVAETLNAETDGVDLTISMNAKYLLDALRALREDRVTISFSGAISPFILQNQEKKDSLYLILPVKNAS
ncbi:MAG: DNA polymerase III subunit beta [Clostridia bacterium]|nr:DNA polymerase III subunit beta [Clostridia bacterium]